MQKVKDGYRASFRLNEDNPEHLEIYQMFQELMNSGKYRKESDLYRAAIVSLYREKQGKRNDLFQDGTLSPVGTKFDNPTLELNQLVCSSDDSGK